MVRCTDDTHAWFRAMVILMHHWRYTVKSHLSMSYTHIAEKHCVTGMETYRCTDLLNSCKTQLKSSDVRHTYKPSMWQMEYITQTSCLQCYSGRTVLSTSVHCCQVDNYKWSLHTWSQRVFQFMYAYVTSIFSQSPLVLTFSSSSC